MEKSMIHELSNSGVFLNRSQITTISTDDVYGLRKSRINNLPNYKKDDLSGKLNFVVVFQGIEIQRLSIEVETLRVRLKDCERLIFNSENYQIQIRQLTEKCYVYEQQVESYRQEIQKMNDICQKLYHALEEMKTKNAQFDFTLKEKYQLQFSTNQQLRLELQKCKNRFATLEKNKNKQIEDLRNIMENSRKSIIDRQIRDLTIRFKSDQSNSQQQIIRINSALQNRNNEIRKLQAHISRLQTTIRELRSYESQIDDYENKVALISQETIRLTQKLKNKQQEVDRLKKNIENLQQNNIKFEDNQDLITKMNKNNEHFKKIISTYQSQKNHYINMERQLNEQKIKIVQMDEQIKRILKVVSQKTSQIKSLKQFVNRVNIGLAQSKNLEQMLAKSLKQIEHFKIKLEEAHQESNFFEDKLILAEDQIRKLQNDLSIACHQRDTVDKIAIQKNIQYEQIKAQNKIKDQQIRFLKDFQRKVNDLQNKLRSNQIVYQQLEIKYKQQCARSQQSDAIIRKLNQSIRIKQQEVISSQFLCQLMKIKQQCEIKDRQIKNLQCRFQTIDNIIKMTKEQLQKQAHFTKFTQQKLHVFSQGVSNFGGFIEKTIKMHTQKTKISEQNVNLESMVAKMLRLQVLQKSHSLKSVQLTNKMPSHNKINQGINNPFQLSNTRFALSSVQNYYY